MNKLSISMYHYVRDLKNSKYPNIKGLDVSLFRKQIEYMKNNYCIVSMEQVIDAVENNIILPEKALLLTFDDGYIDHYTYVLPILEEFKIQGAFFIPGKTFSTNELLDVNKIHFILASKNSRVLVDDIKKQLQYYRGQSFDIPKFEDLYNTYALANRFDTSETIFVKRMLQTVLPESLRNIISTNLFEKYVGVSEGEFASELYLSEKQIRLMKKKGMFIGIHGYDHYWLGNLSQEKMQQDIGKAIEVLDEFIDRKKWVINYPYGNYNQNVITYARDMGACLGFTTKVAIADLDKHNVMELPRFDCNDFWPIT